jgi:HAD superfamily hydrolase (TIGR01549 family)
MGSDQPHLIRVIIVLNGEYSMSKKILAICLDCGDTLVDEATEVKEGDVSLKADLIPGADELLHELKRRGYPLALVADGPTATFENNLNPYGLYTLFDAYAISEELSVLKPHPKMFHYALKQLNISENNYGRVIMVGNNLKRDIKGANELGMISVWMDWSPRRSKVPANQSETPRFTIKKPLGLIAIINSLEESL